MPDDLESFLLRQENGDMARVLLELAAGHESVRERLVRWQKADRPGELARDFRKTLIAIRRQKRYVPYREAPRLADELQGWLNGIEQELTPRDPPAALTLIEDFIKSDGALLERIDDSGGAVGNVLQAACASWLRTAARCPPPAAGWADRIVALHADDDYGTRQDLLRLANLLLDGTGLAQLVAHYESQMTAALAGFVGGSLPLAVYGCSGALSLLSEAAADPDVHVRAVLRYSPEPNALQRESFAQAYLEADRPQDALAWLEDAWPDQSGLHDGKRLDLLAETLTRLGRFEESVRLRRERFLRSPGPHTLDRWLDATPETLHAEVRKEAHRQALASNDQVTAATLLIRLGDPVAAESVLLREPATIPGTAYHALLPIANELGARGLLRGETAILRALLCDVLHRGQSTAYPHAAKYWRRLDVIARSGATLEPLDPHDPFVDAIRYEHGRKKAFWKLVER